MPEQFQVVDDWPPQTVSIMRPERIRRPWRPSKRVLIGGLVAAIGLGIGSYFSGVAAFMSPTPPLELCCENAFSGQRIQYGSPEINVFRPTDEGAPLVMHEIRNTGRWTVTVIAVDDPVGYVIWEHRMSRENAGRGRGVPFRPFTLAPGQSMRLYFVGERLSCFGVPDPSLTSTTLSTGLQVTYRIAGIQRTSVLPGHRYVVEKPGNC